LHTLGHGSYGKVKKCLDTKTGLAYAVKIISRAQFKGFNREKFKEELAAQAM